MKRKTPKRAPAVLHAPLSRRTFLRGTGVAMALPLLDAMWPAMSFAQQAPTPNCRFMGFYIPNGIHMPSWWPATQGAGFEITPILEPVAAFRDQLLVLGGINNRPARPDGPGDHAAGTGSFLTAAHCFKTDGANIRNGQSIDQLIAEQVGQNHRFTSIVLGAEGGGNVGGCDSGYSCAYSRNISWLDDNTPAAKETNPRRAFDRMFGAQDTAVSAEVMRKKRLYRQSVLDFVLEDATRLQAKMGPTDRQKMDEYLNGVRELERQIDLTAAQQCDPGERPDRPDEFQDTVAQMLDLTAIAFQCDLTPVATFMLGNGGSNRAFPFLGIAEGHHQISHHQGAAANHQKLETIDIWELGQLARFLGRLAAIEEGDGTALDNAVVFFSSEIEDGDSHSHFDMPILLAGGAAGQVNGGRYLRYPGGRQGGPSVANLFVTLGQLCGADVQSFGDDSTGPIDLS